MPQLHTGVRSIPTVQNARQNQSDDAKDDQQPRPFLTRSASRQRAPARQLTALRIIVSLERRVSHSWAASSRMNGFVETLKTPPTPHPAAQNASGSKSPPTSHELWPSPRYKHR